MHVVKFFVLPAEGGKGGAKIREEIEFQISVFFQCLMLLII